MIQLHDSKIDITEEDLFKIGYEFYKFYTVFKKQLQENYTIDRDKVEEGEEDLIQYPLYCFNAFITSLTEYQNEIHQETK